MTYGITLDGFVKKPLLTVLEDIEDYQLENLDASLTRDRLSVIGQFNTGNAQEIAELWEAMEASYSSAWKATSSGASLHSIGALTGTYLSKYSKSRVTAQVTLNPNKNLPAGSVANLTGQPNIRFISLTEVPADPSGGTFDVIFEAEESGSTSIGVGQLNEIAEPVSGWTAVNNTAAGTTGTEPETDPEFRLKIENELGAQGSTNVDAIRAAIIQDTDCTACVVLENDTDLLDSNLIPPHHIWVVCYDGTSSAIAQSIFIAKAAAVGTFGSTKEVVTDTQGFDHDIWFSYSTNVNININFTITVQAGYVLSAVQAVVVENLTALINNLSIGENVIYDTVLCTVLNTEGVAAKSLLTINGGTSDISIVLPQKAIPGTIQAI